MTRSIETRIQWAVALCLSMVALLLLTAGQARAANTVYPSGGSGFDAGAEGWSPAGASCAPLAILCTPEAVHDSSAGNPPGSIAAQTTVTINLLDLFKGTVIWNSPQFTVPVGAVTGASVRLDRAFSPGGLLAVGPTGTYTVTLRDLTAGTSATPLSEALTQADTTFATRGGSASVVSGHAYQLSIESVIAQSTLALSLLSGTTAVRFDNVGLQVRTAGDGSGGSGGKAGDGSGGGGGSGLTNALLLSALKDSLVAPATLKGQRLFVKAKCPAKIGHACRVTLQGLLGKGKAATTKRVVKVPKGKTKRIVLKVKPKARGKVTSRNRLLFKETVKAGPAKATLFKRLKLIKKQD
ncbi:MAG: hypothetical protein WA862_05755 [Solirubrobacterales bacterium]